MSPLDTNKHNQSTDETNDWRDTLRHLIEKPTIRRILLTKPQQEYSKDHNQTPNRKIQELSAPYRLICDAKITDIGIMFFTYCPVIVGWFGIKSNQRTVEDLERVLISGQDLDC